METKKFNHESKILAEAIGMPKDFEVVSTIAMAVVDAEKPSHIAEYLHNHASYDEILWMATNFCLNNYHEFMEFMAQRN